MHSPAIAFVSIVDLNLFEVSFAYISFITALNGVISLLEFLLSNVSILSFTAIYLIFFEKSQQIILNKLENNNIKLSQDEKFNFLLLGLGADEKTVLSAIKEQDGITQQTLRIRTNLHKSKLSLIVSSLEEKELIKKEPKGKTNQLFLRVKLD